MKRSLGIVASAALTVPLALAALPATSARAGTIEGNHLTAFAQDLRVWRVEPGDCGFAPFGVTVNDSWDDWAAVVTVRQPSGKIQYLASLSPESSADDAQLCSGNKAGTYSVTVDWVGYDESGNPAASETVVTDLEFTIREAVRTRLKVDPDHVRPGFWKIPGKLTKAGRPFEGARVTIQIKFRGAWRDVKTKTTNRRGVVRFTAEPQPQAAKFPVRLRYDGASHFEPASSKTFRLYP